jgi:hypothetical protein
MTADEMRKISDINHTGIGYNLRLQIINAANNGQYTAQVNGILSDKEQECLRSNGFNVQYIYCKDASISPVTFISWHKEEEK